MNLYAIETNEGILFCRSVAASLAYRTMVAKVGSETINMVRPATITEIENAQPSNITEAA